MPQTDIMYFMPEGTRQSQSLRKLRVIKNSTSMFWSYYAIEIPKNINEDRKKAVKSLMWVSSSDDGERATEISRFSLDENDNIKEDSDGNWVLEKLSLIPPDGDSTPQEDYAISQLESWNWWESESFQANSDNSLPLFGEFNVRKGYEFDYENPLYDGTTDDLYYVYDKDTTVLSYPINFKALFGFDNKIYSDAVISANLVVTNVSASTNVFYSYQDVSSYTTRQNYTIDDQNGNINYNSPEDSFSLNKIDGTLETEGGNISFGTSNSPLYLYLLAESGEGIELTWNRVHENIRINGNSISLNGTLILNNSSAFVKKIKNNQGVFVDLFKLTLTSDALVDDYYLGCDNIYEFGFKYKTINESATEGVIQCYNDYICTHYINLELSDPLHKPSFEKTKKQIISNDYNSSINIYDGKSACDFLKNELNITEPTEKQVEDLLYNGFTYEDETYGPYLVNYPTSTSETVSYPFTTVDSHEEMEHEENTDLEIKIPFSEGKLGKYTRLYVDNSLIEEQPLYLLNADKTILAGDTFSLPEGSIYDLNENKLLVNAGGNLTLEGNETSPITIKNGTLEVNGFGDIKLKNLILDNVSVKLVNLTSDDSVKKLLVNNYSKFEISGGNVNVSKLNLKSAINNYLDLTNSYNGSVSELTFISGYDLKSDQKLIDVDASTPAVSKTYFVDKNNRTKLGDLSQYETGTSNDKLFFITNGSLKLNGSDLTASTSTLPDTILSKAYLLDYSMANFTTVLHEQINWNIKRLANELIIKVNSNQLDLENIISVNQGEETNENVYLYLPNISISYYDQLSSDNREDLSPRINLTEKSSTLDFINDDIKTTETYIKYDGTESIPGEYYKYLESTITSENRATTNRKNFDIYEDGNLSLEVGEEFELRVPDERLIKNEDNLDLDYKWQESKANEKYLLEKQTVNSSDYSIKIEYRTENYNDDTDQFEYSEWNDTTGVKFSVDMDLKNKTHNDLIEEGFTASNATEYLDKIQKKSAISGLPEFRFVLPNHYNIFTFDKIIRFCLVQIWYTKSSKLQLVSDGVFELKEGGNYKELLLVYDMDKTTDFTPSGEFYVYNNSDGTRNEEKIFDTTLDENDPNYDADLDITFVDNGSKDVTISRLEGDYNQDLILSKLKIINNIYYDGERLVNVSLETSGILGHENDHENYTLIDNITDDTTNNETEFKLIRSDNFDYETDKITEKIKLKIEWISFEVDSESKSNYVLNLTFNYGDVKEIYFDGLRYKNYDINEGTNETERYIDVSKVYDFEHENQKSLDSIEYKVVGFEKTGVFYVSDDDLKSKLTILGLNTDDQQNDNSNITLTPGGNDYVESKNSLDTNNNTKFYLPELDYFQKPEIKLFMRARVNRTDNLIGGDDTQKEVEKEFFLLNVKVGPPSSNSFVISGTNSLSKVTHSVNETLGVKEESWDQSYHNPDISLGNWLNNVEHQDNEGDNLKKFKLTEIDSRLEIVNNGDLVSVNSDVSSSYLLRLKDNLNNKLDNNGDEKDFSHHDYERQNKYTVKYEVYIPRYTKLEGITNPDSDTVEYSSTTNIDTSNDKLYYFEFDGNYHGPLSKFPYKMEQLDQTKAFVKSGDGKKLFKTKKYTISSNPPSIESATVETELAVIDRTDLLPTAPQPYRIKKDVVEDYYTANPITQGVRISSEFTVKEGVKNITNIYAQSNKLGTNDSEGNLRSLANDLSDSGVGLYEGDTGYDPDNATTSNIDLLGFKLEFNHPWSNAEEAELVNTIKADNIDEVYTKAQLQFTKTAELGRIYKFTVAAITNMKPTNNDLLESDMNASGLYGFDNLEYPKYYLDYDENNKPTFTSTKPDKDVELYVRRVHFVVSVTDEEDIMVVSRNGVKVNKRLELAEEITFKYSDANVEEIDEIVDNKIIGVEDGNATGDVRLFRQGDTSYLAYWDGVNWEIVQ